MVIELTPENIQYFEDGSMRSFYHEQPDRFYLMNEDRPYVTEMIIKADGSQPNGTFYFFKEQIAAVLAMKAFICEGYKAYLLRDSAGNKPVVLVDQPYDSYDHLCTEKKSLEEDGWKQMCNIATAEKNFSDGLFDYGMYQFEAGVYSKIVDGILQFKVVEP